MESCYWARLKNLSGGFDAIIANDNSVGQFYIEVRPTDHAFEIACHAVLFPVPSEPPAEYPESITAGTYLVGIDIKTGTYRGLAGEDIMNSCYWARLRDVTGEFTAIIANDNAIGQFYLQVAPSDFALEVACEVTWVSD